MNLLLCAISLVVTLLYHDHALSSPHPIHHTAVFESISSSTNDVSVLFCDCAAVAFFSALGNSHSNLHVYFFSHPILHSIFFILCADLQFRAEPAYAFSLCYNSTTI